VPRRRINAVRAATLMAGLQVSHVDGVPALPDNAPIVAAGGVSGQFAVVTGEAPAQGSRRLISRTASCWCRWQNGFVDLARTGNERAVAAALDASTNPPVRWWISCPPSRSVRSHDLAMCVRHLIRLRSTRR